MMSTSIEEVITMRMIMMSTSIEKEDITGDQGAGGEMMMRGEGGNTMTQEVLTLYDSCKEEVLTLYDTTTNRSR